MIDILFNEMSFSLTGKAFSMLHKFFSFTFDSSIKDGVIINGNTVIANPIILINQHKNLSSYEEIANTVIDFLKGQRF